MFIKGLFCWYQSYGTLLSVNQKFENVDRHTASRQNVVLVEDTRLDKKTLQSYHRMISGLGANHTLAASRKPDAQTKLVDIALQWWSAPKGKTLRDQLGPHAHLNGKPFEPIQLKGTAAKAISPPEQFRKGNKAGDYWVSPGGHVMVWCPPGKFIMGDAQFEDAPPTEVTIKNGFWINKYEFPRGMGNMPHSFPYNNNRPESTIAKHHLTQPHFNVGDFGGLDGLINRYIDPIPAPEGWSWDLPTEAEWEYACRAGSKEGFPCEFKDLGQYANFAYKSLYDDRAGVGFFRQVAASGPIHFTFAYQGAEDGYAHEYADIGSFRPNAWGIHDMLGNLAELCVGYYDPGKMTEVNYGTGRHSVLRGGAWCHPPEYLHASFRNMHGAVNASNRYVGFRLVLREGPRLLLKKEERDKLAKKKGRK